MKYKNRLYFYILFFLFFMACFLVVVVKPNKFQKWNSIKSQELYKDSRILVTERELEAEEFIGNIPYREGGGYVWSVHPQKKYERTILNGYGDCSTMSFGAAYILLEKGISFELIHFMPPETLFSGGGHVALRVPYEYKSESRVGIVDIVGGGFPFTEKKDYLDIDDLESINFSASIYRVNEKASKFSENYYKQNYLEKIYFGFTPHIEVNQYFRFIENFYVPFGNARFEKMAYDGLAILLGQYYSIYMEEAFLDKFKLEAFFFRFLLYSIRALLIFGLVTILFELYLFSAKKLKNCL